MGKRKVEKVVKATTKGTEYIEVELPSRGLLYENNLASVMVRGMYTTEEKFLAGARRDFQGVLDKLFSKNGCIDDLDGMHPSDLLSSDRLYLLFIVRMLSYGKTYTFKIKCDECDFRFSHTIKLMEGLDITYMEEGVEEPFEVDLSNKTVGFRLLRGKDEKMIDKYVRRARQRDAVDPLEDPSYIHRLARHVVTVDGETVDLRGAENHMKMSAIDAQEFKDAIEDRDSGVDLTLRDLDCPECDAPLEEVMPFTAEFFRTSKRRK